MNAILMLAGVLLWVVSAALEGHVSHFTEWWMGQVGSWMLGWYMARWLWEYLERRKRRGQNDGETR